MQMVGRTFSAGTYRYGFNGKEKNNEFSEGVYDLGARIYDSRNGRMFSGDPMASFYAWQTPYAYINNSPVSKIDFNGEGDYYDVSGKKLGSDGKTITQGKGKNAKKVTDDKAYVTSQDVISANTVNGVTNWDKVIGDASTSKLNIKNSVLQDMASSIYDESGGNRVESFALGSTIINGSNFTKKSITSFLKNYTSGYDTKKSYSVTGNGKSSMEAAINAVLGGIDYSGGAQFWDGKDVFLWSNHFRYLKAAFDTRQGIFVPDNMMGRVMNLQYDLMIDYMNRGVNSKDRLKSGYWTSFNAVYNNQMTVRTKSEIGGALWKVVAVHGHSVFYSQIPLNESSRETTTPRAYTLPDASSILLTLPKK
jgi:RHS repeat-associated protein